MKLSKLERLILINQYRILSELRPNESDKYNELIEILENGFTIFYSEIGNWINDDIPEEEGKLVLDILSLYRIIDDYIRANPKHSFQDHSWIYFRGFDGNHETSYMGFAQFLIIEQHKFSEQESYLEKNDNLNSHMPTLHKYQSMIEAWKDMGKKYKLTEDEIRKILDA